MRSKRYSSKRVGHAQVAANDLTAALHWLDSAVLNLRLALDERAAVGIEQAAKRVRSWRAKVSESLARSGGR